MKDYCVEVQEAILKHGQVQEDLTDEQLLHVENCKACTQILKESMQISTLLKNATAVPPAPDCRTAVISRIRPVNTRRPVFAYTFAALFLIFISILGVLHIRSGSSVTTNKPIPIVRNDKPASSGVNSADLPDKKDDGIKKNTDTIALKPINKTFIRPKRPSKPAGHDQNNELTIPEPVHDIDKKQDEAPVNETTVVVDNKQQPEFSTQDDEESIIDNRFLCRYTVQKNQAGETVTWMVFLPSSLTIESSVTNERTDELRDKIAHHIGPKLARSTDRNAYTLIKGKSKPCETYIAQL